jgi:DNA-binding response OmpR family regulator
VPETVLLVVSDDPSVQEEMTYGAPSGVQVLSARDAREAWRRLVEITPSVAVVDLQTGSAGGFALMKDMAADERLQRVPVMMLLEREQDAWLARQAGAADYRVKPVEAAGLVSDSLGLIPV